MIPECYRITWDNLRWVATTSQLKHLADRVGVDYSDIPSGCQFKRKLAKRLAKHYGLKEGE